MSGSYKDYVVTMPVIRSLVSRLLQGWKLPAVHPFGSYLRASRRLCFYIAKILPTARGTQPAMLRKP